MLPASTEPSIKYLLSVSQPKFASYIRGFIHSAKLGIYPPPIYQKPSSPMAGKELNSIVSFPKQISKQI